MLKIIYEVSRSMSEETNTFDTLKDARHFAMGLFKSHIKKFESVFINQKIYVNGVYMDVIRIDYFFYHPQGIEWCFRRENDSYYDFFLKEEE